LAVAGAISNILARVREPLLAAALSIRETVTASEVVCSDETSARVVGKTWWEWVFVGTLAVLHIIRPSRGRAVVQGAVPHHSADGLGLRYAG
jgi:transposase